MFRTELMLHRFTRAGRRTDAREGRRDHQHAANKDVRYWSKHCLTELAERYFLSSLPSFSRVSNCLCFELLVSRFAFCRTAPGFQ